jgi:pimeloyl-ACP methyl ester carboxylesterase
MRKIVTSFISGIGLCVLGVVVVTLRYILRTPQPLENVLPGEPRLYKWTHGHIYYKVLGAADAVPIVLLHAPGIGASSYEMRALMEGLARRYRVYALDLLGFGLSDHPKVDYSAQLYIALCRDFLTAVVARPAMLLASGLSCNYCVAVAASAPELCERLILLSPRSLVEGAGKRNWLFDVVQWPLVDLMVYSLLTTRGILRSLLARRQGIDDRQVAASDLRMVDATAHQLGAERAAIASIAGKLALDISHQLETVEQPTLILWGTQTLAQTRLPPQQHTLLEHAEVVFMQDAGLSVQEERPEQVVATILNWQTVVTEEDAMHNGHKAADLAHAIPSSITPSSAVPPATGPEEIEAYCVKCRHKRPIQNPQEIVTKNGRHALEGTCPVCDTKLFRFVAVKLTP